MIYFSKEQLIIRNMKYEDVQAITDAEIGQEWSASIKKYHKRLENQKTGKVISLVVEYFGKPVRYINVYPDSIWGAFGEKGYPEIVDFGVLEKYQKQGIGTVLMNVIEKIATKYADIVYLGVGFHSGYESVQRMYVKRGYLPDGSGV